MLVPVFTFRMYFPTRALGELVTDSRHWGGDKERWHDGPSATARGTAQVEQEH